MTRENVDIIVEWAAREGWNPGLHDADCYFIADPTCFLVGFVDDEPVASISAVKYGASFGFVGFYIVKPECRGRGYGMKIWNAGLKSLEGRNIGLDGVVDQQQNYEKSGFRLSYRNIRYEGMGGGGQSEDADILFLSNLSFEIIDAYDRPLFPEDRSRFIRSWINQPGCHALGIMSDDKLAGYGVIRACRSGYKIGPLFADRPEYAKTLFSALKSRVDASSPVFLDVPAVNQAAVALAEDHDMKIVFETARMYSGKAPDISLDRQYGVTSFEVG